MEGASGDFFYKDAVISGASYVDATVWVVLVRVVQDEGLREVRDGFVELIEK